MATTTAHETNNHYDGAAKDYSSSNSGNPAGAAIGRQMTHEEHQTATAAARFGYGPLAHINTAESGRLPAFGGEFQPGTYRSVAQRKFANPAPLGLCAFALTTFVLSLINMGTRDVAAPNIVVAIALGYGGLVQLLAGMWYVNSRRTSYSVFRAILFSVLAAQSLTRGRWLGKWLSATLSVLLLFPPTGVSGLLLASSLPPVDSRLKNQLSPAARAMSLQAQPRSMILLDSF